MNLKAGEVSFYFRFLIDEMTSIGGVSVFGAELIGAGVALREFIDECKLHKVLVPEDGIRRLQRSMDTFVNCCKSAGMATSPKFHQLGHYVLRIRGQVITKRVGEPTSVLCMMCPWGCVQRCLACKQHATLPFTRVSCSSSLQFA
jgi:hypothetical protein